MQVSRSAYYAWRASSTKVISADELNVYRRAKALFKASRDSLGSRELSKKLREEGIDVGRYRARSLMRKLGLEVKQRTAYKITTKRKLTDRVADNLLNLSWFRDQVDTSRRVFV